MRSIPDEPTVDEAKALVFELLDTCPIHHTLMERKGHSNELTGKSCFYTCCPECQKSGNGTVTLEFSGPITHVETNLTLRYDEI